MNYKDIVRQHKVITSVTLNDRVVTVRSNKVRQYVYANKEVAETVATLVAMFVGVKA